MIFHKQKLEGVFIIEPTLVVDNRGTFRRHFCQNEMAAQGIDFSVKQGNISENTKKFTLRGFHYQNPPFGEDKTISCVSGEIFNVVIDLRENSSTYLQWESFNLSRDNRLSLVVPKGCANAYLTLEDNTWIFYYHSQFYTPGAEGGIRYDDPYFNIPWPQQPHVISDKDLSYPDFKPAPATK